MKACRIRPHLRGLSGMNRNLQCFGTDLFHDFRAWFDLVGPRLGVDRPQYRLYRDGPQTIHGRQARFSRYHEQQGLLLASRPAKAFPASVDRLIIQSPNGSRSHGILGSFVSAGVRHVATCPGSDSGSETRVRGDPSLRSEVYQNTNKCLY